MARPRTLPDSGTLAKLRRKHTIAAIAEMYGVTENAVYYHLRDAGLTKKGNRYRDTIPWQVAMEHQDAYEAQMLRELGKRLAGEPGGSRGAYLDAWLRGLDEKPRQVIAYDREKGFHRVRRMPQDKGGYIRKPPKERLPRTRKAPSSQPT